MQHNYPYDTESLETCVRHRHSIRFYKDTKVDDELLRECVALAQLAPSNSNMQNWRLTLASGPARERIVNALKTETERRGPNIPELPDEFKHFRSELGQKLYGEEGYNIDRDEKEKRQQAVMRNFEFFGAPVCGVITMYA